MRASERAPDHADVVDYGAAAVAYFVDAGLQPFKKNQLIARREEKRDRRVSRRAKDKSDGGGVLRFCHAADVPLRSNIRPSMLSDYERELERVSACAWAAVMAE